MVVSYGRHAEGSCQKSSLNLAYSDNDGDGDIIIQIVITFIFMV